MFSIGDTLYRAYSQVLVCYGCLCLKQSSHSIDGKISSLPVVDKVNWIYQNIDILDNWTECIFERLDIRSYQAQVKLLILAARGQLVVVDDLYQRKRKRSDSVLWQKPLHQQKSPKSNTTTQNTPPKTSITQRLRTDLGRSVGVTAVTPLVWLNRLTSAQPSH